MINLSELPRDPYEAFEKLLSQLLKVSRTTEKIGAMRADGDPKYMELLVLSSAAKKSVERFQDPDLRDEILRLLTINPNSSAAGYGKNVENALNVFYVSKLDDHFLDSEDVSSFENVVLEADEKDEIRDLMSKARDCVARCSELGQWRRRNINHWITKIENEVFKDISNWQTFVTGAFTIIELAEAAGKALDPAAEAAKKARTITHEKLEGQKQIAADEDLKLLENKSEN